MITVKMGRRGQFTLPRVIRRAMGVNEGDRVLLIPNGDQVMLRVLPQTLLDLRGSVPVSGEQDFTAIRKKVFATLGKTAENK
ncbi:MAG: AbrB/MazE/SpoVT family DNA-binding domain-containing protein [Chloroflexi bacterium]|nr:AbrB/MazE/SpoVT family DNA-binding domain-containing protein [Chloroflexota bacterium]